MDNLTHALASVGLAQLSTLSPQLAAQPEIQQAILWASLIGSQAPDLDIILKLKSEETYLKHHRGFSHSLISQIMIPVVTAGALKIFYPSVAGWLLLAWGLAATLLHIFLDILTSYGTRALWPLSSKRIAWDTLMTFDILIFLFLVTGLILTQLGLHPGLVFLAIFACTGLYIIIRAINHHRMKIKLARYFQQNIEDLSLIPTLMPHKWNFIVEKDSLYYVGYMGFWAKIITEGIYPRHKIPFHLQEIAFSSRSIQVFYEFARHPLTLLNPHPKGHELKVLDLRYRFRDRPLFSASVSLDQDLNIIGSQLIPLLGRRR